MKKGIIFAFVVIGLLFVVSAQSHEKTSAKICGAECLGVQKEGMAECNENYAGCRELCDDLVCKRVCSKEKTVCVRNVGAEFKSCKEDCKAESMPKCMNGTYKYGETFADGCDICECGARGKIRCKREAFCNKNVSVGKEDCELGNGFYQALCNGPYFGIVCSQQEFCICQGDNNYGCPENYECMTDFVSPNKRKTLEGWKTLLGKPLGDIGVCGKNESINQNSSVVL